MSGRQSSCGNRNRCGCILPGSRPLRCSSGDGQRRCPHRSWSIQENIDENYYFKGYHVSGIEGSLAGAQTIDQDIVFVASYGVKNDLVEYYVNYVDESGAGIGPVRNTYKGNVGDNLVVAFIYIDGYRPLVKNYSITIKEGEPNELTFEYRRNRVETITVEDVIEGTGGGTVTPGPGTAPAEETVPEEAEAPIEIIDIDEPETPQAEPADDHNDSENKGDEETEFSFLQKYGLLLAGGFISLLLFLLLFLLFRRRHSDEE